MASVLHSLHVSAEAPTDRKAETPFTSSTSATLRKHLSLALLLGLGVVCTLDAFIISALITPIKGELGLKDEMFGIVAATFTAAGMIGAPVFGYAAGRIGRKRALIGGAVLWSLASAGGALASGVVGLMLWRGLTGFGEAAYQGLAPSWLSDLYERRWRNFVFSLYMVRNKLGSAIGLALGAWLAAHYDWRVAFLASGVPGLVLAGGLLFLREPAPGASDGETAARRRLSLGEQLRVLAIPPYVAHLIALAFFYSGTATAQVWAPAFLHRQYGLSNLAASGFMAAVLLFTAPVGLIGGFLAGRTLAGHASGLTWALAGTSLLAATFFAIAFASHDLATTKLFIVLAVIAFGSTAGSLTTLLVEFVPALLRASAGSIGAFVSAAISGAVAPWLLGHLSDRYGLGTAIFVGPAAYAVAAIVWAGAALTLFRSTSHHQGASRP